MINAKDELLEALEGIDAGVRCATIVHKPDCPGSSTEVSLKVGHTPADFEEFLDQLDFDYDNGYGIQELYGYVWLDDKTWLDRDEYDGAEGWEHQQCPGIPAELMFE
jgi:hypothetical protein